MSPWPLKACALIISLPIAVRVVSDTSCERDNTRAGTHCSEDERGKIMKNHQKSWISIDFHWFSLIFDFFCDFPRIGLAVSVSLTWPTHHPYDVSPTTKIAHGSGTSEPQSCRGHWDITKHPAVLKSWNYVNIQIFMILPFFHTVFTTLKKKQNYIASQIDLELTQPS